MTDPRSPGMLQAPETRYATRPDGAHIAYQQFGSGSIDLVWIPHLLFNVDLMWEFEPIARWLTRLGSFARVVIFDPVGTGLSDRHVEPGDVDARSRDLLSLLDELGIERAAIMGSLHGGALGAVFAATYPTRVTSLVWYNAYLPRPAMSPTSGDIPAWGTTERAARMAGTEGPTGQVDAAFQQWMGRMLRSAVSPGRSTMLVREWEETNVASILPHVSVPTLVLVREGFGTEMAKEAAGLIPGAKFVILPGRDAMPWFGDMEGVASTIGAFVGAGRPEPAGGRFLATVLLSDIVGSTERSSHQGDGQWAEVMRDHHRLVRGLLKRHGGREMDTAGDGFFAAFDTPADAARCALAIVEAVRVIDIEVRIGLHTGECQVVDGKVAGTAVAIGARVATLADPSTVLATSTVRNLTAGSGLVFEDAGEHRLKGITDPWRLFRVRAGSS